MRKKTSEEWERLSGYHVIDPDGWDRGNFDKSWNERITEDEFNQRLMKSTVERLFKP